MKYVGHIIPSWNSSFILKEISPGFPLEGMMLKLKFQYFGHLMRRVDSLEKTLMLGGIGDDRGWDGWMTSPTRWTWVWVNSGSWWWTGRPGMLQFMGSQRVGHDWATELELDHLYGFPGGSIIRNLPVKQEMQARFLSWEDPLQKERQPTPAFLPGKSHGQRNWQATVYGVAKEPDTT